MEAIPPKPAASAARARSTNWSMVSRICGRKTQYSSAVVTGILLVSTCRERDADRCHRTP